MKVTRFVVKNVAEEGARKAIHIGTLDFEVITGGCNICNIRPFKIEIDELGMIHNYSDRVKVSISDNVNRIIRFDTMSIFSIANHAEVQRKINELASINKLTELDAALQEVGQLNAKVAASVREVEMELLLEDLLAMNREHAIDMALDAGDVEAFNRLMEVHKIEYSSSS